MGCIFATLVLLRGSFVLQNLLITVLLLHAGAGIRPSLLPHVSEAVATMAGTTFTTAVIVYPVLILVIAAVRELQGVGIMPGSMFDDEDFDLPTRLKTQPPTEGGSHG